MKSNKLKREPKYIAKFKAFPYQQEAVDAVKDLEYAAIFHEQGLGKTKIAIDVLLYWLSECSMDSLVQYQHRKMPRQDRHIHLIND